MSGESVNDGGATTVNVEWCPVTLASRAASLPRVAEIARRTR